MTWMKEKKYPMRLSPQSQRDAIIHPTNKATNTINHTFSAFTLAIETGFAG
jgi:hypothetical protein